MRETNLSPQALVDALCKRIESALSPSFWHESESGGGEYHAPHVHAQHLPVSKTGDKERDKSKGFPIVQVICDSGEVKDFSQAANGSEIKIKIAFGARGKGEDNQGWRLAMAMLWRARSSAGIN